MKKLWMLALCIALLCFGGCTKEAAANSQELYGEVLAKYYDLIAHPDGDRLFADGECGVFEAAQAIGDEALNTIGYVFTDLNGDGTDELLVGVFDKAEGAHVKNELYAGYTLAGDAPVLLFEGWARNAYSLMDGGSLYYYGSGGAMYSIFGEAVVNGDALEWVDYYFTHETEGNGIPMCPSNWIRMRMRSLRCRTGMAKEPWNWTIRSLRSLKRYNERSD